MITRRHMLQLSAKTAVLLPVGACGLLAQAPSSTELNSRRPAPRERKFRSAAIDAYLTETSRHIGDPQLAWLFQNCFPNTLDTTVETGMFEGKPDTAVITGDIAAMWLRDSSAQVWPYLRFAAQDEPLRRMLEGIIRRQARCILIDPYANAFMADLTAPPLEWSRTDITDHKPGVGERKWELDSLCYPIRLSYGYWKATGDTSPFDQTWRAAMTLAVVTMRVQQRKNGLGPYRFQRASPTPTETLPNEGSRCARPAGWPHLFRLSTLRRRLHPSLSRSGKPLCDQSVGSVGRDGPQHSS